MNINELEHLTGITKQNIRFYEKKELIQPMRNLANNYREYSADDLARLKTIKLLRKLDLPLEDIGKILSEEMPLQTALEEQLQVLENRQKELNGCINICKSLLNTELKSLNVDETLDKMKTIEENGGRFMSIIQDYKKFVASESQKRFSFKPDTMIRNSSEFTEALCQYAEENGMNLFITKEGMYPSFELNGTAYTAYRAFDRFGATIHCTSTEPDKLEDIPQQRKRVFRLIHSPYLLMILIFLIMAVSRQSIGWTILAAVTLFPYLWWMFSGFR
ncbi:MAG: MerR family transcriptional regulator [Lachnospiraceae bacterium]|nr:MerR family transcriptional regulator [Lachnospiraceae bacterium]